MSENDNGKTSFLAKFDSDLWKDFKKTIEPYGYLKDVVRDLIKVFTGRVQEVNPEIVEKLEKELKEVN